MARTGSPNRPSPRHGWRRATQLWRLVLVGTVVSWVAFAPALLVVRLGVFPALAALPEQPGVLPTGDVGLIILEVVRPILRPFGLAMISGLLVLWWWSVLWHAGVVAWELWTGARRVRLGEVLGLGMVAWWRYARLSATAAAVLAMVGLAIWIPLRIGVRGAFHAMAEDRMMALLLIGIVATKLLAIVVWLATLNGAWVLGLPERRSAVWAWLLGLANVVRRPLSSLATWLVWLVPGWLAAVAPIWVGIRFPDLRGTLALIAFGLLAALVRSFCWVGMFASFAPVTGLVGDDDEAEAGEKSKD